MFYWLLLKGIQSKSIPGSWRHDRLARSSPAAKWFLFFFLPANADSSGLQCSLERIQNRQKLQWSLERIQNRRESEWTFAGNLSGFFCLVSRHPVACLLKAPSAWSTGSAGSPAPKQGPPLVSTTRSGSRLSSQLRLGWRARRRGVDPLAHLTGERVVSLAYKCVCRQGNKDVHSKILARDLFFFFFFPWVACIH